MNETYLGNANIKRDGVVHNFTQHEVQEYAKVFKDPSTLQRIIVRLFILTEA
jgi:hypothetical protein